jgi:hypothetical protein
VIEQPPKQTAEQPVGPAYTPEMVAILDRACQGDERIVHQLRQLLAEHPELVDQFGNLARHAEEAFLNVLASSSLLGKEAVRIHLANLKEELGQSSASPLENLLISRIAVTWLQLHQADLDGAAVLKTGKSTTSFSMHAHRRLDQAHRRYLASIKQLALVRKLLKPTPSILDLAMRPIPETDLQGARQRERNTSVNAGVPVFN